ncbi:MAG: hypothetical protein ABFD97_18380 [Syntrophobacter sp.]
MGPRGAAIQVVRPRRGDSFTEIGSAFGPRARGFVGSVPDLMQKRLAPAPDLIERCRQIMKSISIGHPETWPQNRKEK